MKIYVDMNKNIVGYMIVGDHNKEYALNTFEVQTKDKQVGITLGLMRAIKWTKFNTPLYCDLSNINYYSHNKPISNSFLNVFNIKKVQSFSEEDTNLLNRVKQNINWKIQCIIGRQNSR